MPGSRKSDEGPAEKVGKKMKKKKK